MGKVTGLTALLLGGAASFLPAVAADEPATIEVIIKGHQFSPAEIHVPTGKPVILHISNQDRDRRGVRLRPP